MTAIRKEGRKKGSQRRKSPTSGGKSDIDCLKEKLIFDRIEQGWQIKGRGADPQQDMKNNVRYPHFRASPSSCPHPSSFPSISPSTLCSFFFILCSFPFPSSSYSYLSPFPSSSSSDLPLVPVFLTSSFAHFITFFCEVFIEIKLVEGRRSWFPHCRRESCRTQLGHRALELRRDQGQGVVWHSQCLI